MICARDSMKLCSACLLGIPCRYDGKSKPNAKVLDLAKKEVLIPICPEQLGGLPTPREESQRDGNRIVTPTGRDLTKEFQKGAENRLLSKLIYQALNYKCPRLS